MTGRPTLAGRLRVGVGNTVDRRSVTVYTVRVDDDGDWLGCETMLSIRPIAERSPAVTYARRLADVLDAEFHDEQSVVTVTIERRSRPTVSFGVVCSCSPSTWASRPTVDADLLDYAHKHAASHRERGDTVTLDLPTVES